VAFDPPAARVASQMTSRIPVVVRSNADPVAEGFVASLGRPGGNVTGLSSESAELHGKRLELLRELDPQVSRIAVLWNDRNPGHRLQLESIRSAAGSIGAEAIFINVNAAENFEATFAAAQQNAANGLILVRDPLFVGNRGHIVDLAARSRLLAVYDDGAFVAAGGIVSYGANLDDLYRRAAVYVDKILKGAKPADLPVEQPTKFELVLNLTAAKALGVTVPPALLARADEVIE
jgi:putative ABC transport system substrate-binding protein